jgi:hypothetical protein
VEMDSAATFHDPAMKPSIVDSDSDLFVVNPPAADSHSHSSHSHSNKKEKVANQADMVEMFEKSVQEMLKRYFISFFLPTL